MNFLAVFAVRRFCSYAVFPLLPQCAGHVPMSFREKLESFRAHHNRSEPRFLGAAWRLVDSGGFGFGWVRGWLSSVGHGTQFRDRHLVQQRCRLKDSYSFFCLLRCNASVRAALCVRESSRG